MTTDADTQTTAPTAEAPDAGRITIDDVRQALGDTDPTKTNAGALRALIGRGGTSTVQKYLDAIRAERTAAPAAAPGAAPAPKDVIDAVWAVAYQAAQVHTLGRLERVTAEREQLTAEREQLRADLDTAQATADAATEAADAATATAATATAALETAQAQAKADAEAASQTLASSQAQAAQAMAAAQTEIDRITAATTAAAALAEREHQIRITELQAALDRQADKYADLRNMLDKLTPAAAPPATKK